MSTVTITEIINGITIEESVTTVTLSGDPGPQGATGPAGSFNFLGAWSSLTSYAVDDTVTHGGSTYIAIQSSLNQTPPNATYWALAAAKGDTGTTGATGPGVPTGGSTQQYLRKIDGADYNTEWDSLTKSDVGLSNVDNTSDASKPVSTAQQTALDGKSNVGHGHAISDVTSLQTTLDGKLAKASNLSDVTSARTSAVNLGLGATKLGGLAYMGHSWNAGVGIASTGTPRFQRQGFIGRIAAMMNIAEGNLKCLSTAGGYLIKPRSSFNSPYGGWAGAYAFFGPYSSPNFSDPATSVTTHPPMSQPWPALISHGINDAAFYGTSTTATTHLQVRNGWKHALRAAISKHRSGTEFGSYYSTAGAAAFSTALTFSGTWSNQTVNPSDAQLSGASGPFRKDTATNTDYVEFLIPTDFQGGVIAMSFVAQMNGWTTLSTASMNNTDVTTAITVGSTFTTGTPTFPDSGNFRIKMSGSSEEMLVTAGQGSASWTVTRGHNGTTKTTHAAGEQITMLDTGLLVTFSTNGSNGTISGTQTLQGQGAIGGSVGVVKRFVCTAADAGKTIRATVSGIVSGDTHVRCQFDAVWIENPNPPPMVIENITRWMMAGSTGYSTVTTTQYGDINTDTNTVVAEFDDCVKVADVDTPYYARTCFPQSTINNTDVTTTVNVTANDAATFATLGTGWIMTSLNERMLVTANSLVSGSTFSVTLTRGFGGSTKQTHTTARLMADQTWMHTDNVHPNALGHAVRAQVVHDTFSSIYSCHDSPYGDAISTGTDTQDAHQMHFGIVDNFYQQPQVGGALTANTTFTLNELWFFPFFVPERCIMVNAGIVTGTTAGIGSAARFGLYAPGINRGVPASLIRELGTVATTSTATLAQVTTHAVLEPGTYWIGVVNQGGTAGGVRTITDSNWIGFTPTYVAAVPTGTALDTFYQQAAVSGALPTTATPVSDAGPMPFVWVKFRKPPYL